MFKTRFVTLCAPAILAALTGPATAEEPNVAPAPPAGQLVVGDGPGWRPLKEADFTHVNDEPDTWKFLDDQAEIHGTGMPVGVIRTKDKVKNFELVVEWRHLKSGGNSGVFVWAPEKVLTGLKPGHLPPGGIEVQILDHGYAEQYQLSTGKKPDWFTTHGDVFPVGSSKMKPFPPISPDGSRSFPTKNRSRGLNEWNHYYIRGVNGEVRLWVNGEEVSGGAECNPSEGFLCLEAEGAPIEFRNLRIRNLP
ncbi:3-keto-disaccharide hydrolase [Paludisphaera soli]|uniref:3-keto-disaccharide hydrolase n=1 Tax=Paludisphaera soli TaxID=2712865 RepID=UPI0013EA766A|nr:DUF1080 domain-containing protein [Paludisphaera soli]